MPSKIMELSNNQIELRQMNGAVNNGHFDITVSGPESAVLVVGSTGTGKSSTIAKCTNQPIRIGDGHKPVTRCCQVYR